MLGFNGSVPAGLCQRRVSMDNIPLYFISLNQAVQAHKIEIRDAGLGRER